MLARFNRQWAQHSGVAFWDLAHLGEKPRFSKLRGQVQSIDVWDETLLVSGKGRRCS